MRACVNLNAFSFWPNEDYTADLPYSVLHSALLFRKDTLEQIEITRELYDKPSTAAFGGSFAAFPCLRYLYIEDVLMLGAPPGWTTDWRPSHEWTTFKPARDLVDLLPLSLETIHLIAQTNRISDKTDLLRNFPNQVSKLPFLRAMKISESGEESFGELSRNLSERGVKFSAD